MEGEIKKLTSSLACLNSPSIPALTEFSTSIENDRGPSYDGDHAEGDNHGKKQDNVDTETQTTDGSNDSTPSKPNSIIRAKTLSSTERT